MTSPLKRGYGIGIVHDSSFFPYLQILTRDSVTVRVDGVVYFRIFNPTMSVVKVENAYNSTFLLAQTTMRSVLGTKNLAELLSDREAISNEMGVCFHRICVWTLFLLLL